MNTVNEETEAQHYQQHQHREIYVYYAMFRIVSTLLQHFHHYHIHSLIIIVFSILLKKNTKVVRDIQSFLLLQLTDVSENIAFPSIYFTGALTPRLLSEYIYLCMTSR